MKMNPLVSKPCHDIQRYKFLIPHFPYSDVHERRLIAEFIFGNNSCGVDSL